MQRFFIFSFLAMFLISPVQALSLSSVNDELVEFPIPQKNWIVTHPTPLEQMYFGNLTDCVVYQNESVEIKDCSRESQAAEWKSEDNWRVSEAIVADLNRDGYNELVMVVWRPFKPWPIDTFLPHGGRINDFQDQNGMSCHLILVGWDGERYRELWAGSSLIDPVFNIRSADLNGDGVQELIALEGKYDSGNKSGSLTVWEWSGFGFRLQSRNKSKVSNYAVASNDQQVWILSE